jgi:hypothetical protein
VEEEKNGPPTLRYLFYELPFPVLPFHLDRFFVVNGWANGHGQFMQSVRIVDSTRTKTLLDTGSQAFSLKQRYEPFMVNSQIDGLVFSEEGVHWVQTYLGEDLVLEYPLTIRMVAGTIKIQPPDAVARPKRFTADF